MAKTMRRIAVIEFDEEAENYYNDAPPKGVGTDGLYNSAGLEGRLGFWTKKDEYVSNFKVILLQNQGEK